MRLREIELRRLEMTLVAPVATAKERHVRRPILLLRVTTDEGVGYGECDALETTRYAGESIDTAEVTLAQSIIPDLLKRGAEYSSLEEAVGSLSTQGAAPMATSAIEMALMDAALHREEGRSRRTSKSQESRFQRGRPSGSDQSATSSRL